MEFLHRIRKTASIPHLITTLRRVYRRPAAFLPLFIEFRPVPERFLRTHLCRGKGRVKARPTKRFLLRMNLAQKHRKAANEGIARPSRINGGNLEWRHEFRSLLVRQKTAALAPGDDHALDALHQ